MPFSGVVTGGGGIIIISHLSLTFRSTSRAFIWHQKVHSHPSVSPSERQSAFLPPEEERWQETGPERHRSRSQRRRLWSKGIKPQTKSASALYCTTNYIFPVFDL